MSKLFTQLLFSILFTLTIFAQQGKEEIFKDASIKLQEADKTEASLVSPKNYEKGLSSFKKAEEKFNKNSNLSDIKELLDESIGYFTKAIENATLAKVTFANSLTARNDALNAEAKKFSLKLWEEGEKNFRSAALELESGDLDDAKEYNLKAEKNFRDAELESIKANYLNETLQLHQKSSQLDVDDFAPLTLKNSVELIKLAEKELTENRYDTDYPRNLVQQAKTEALRALYMTDLFKQMKEEDKTWENLLLNSEEPIRRIAASLDIAADFSKGIDPVAGLIIQSVETKDKKIADLEQEKSSLQKQITEYRKQIISYETELGGIVEEKSELNKKLVAMEKVREQFKTVENIFNPSEVQVFREGDDVILRLVSLTFDVGKSDIDPAHFELLSKVQKSFNTFPGCGILVEGHTDSFGSDDANLELSQKRADAVLKYLTASMNIEPNRIAAMGYGETKPIASNDTKEGRAKNRRIDIIIKPVFD